jgi:hypothetical protein
MLSKIKKSLFNLSIIGGGLLHPLSIKLGIVPFKLLKSFLITPRDGFEDDFADVVY